MMERWAQFYEIVCERLIERVSIQGLILPNFISGFAFIGKKRMVPCYQTHVAAILDQSLVLDPDLSTPSNPDPTFTPVDGFLAFSLGIVISRLKMHLHGSGSAIGFFFKDIDIL
jgi:hypothetical protein